MRADKRSFLLASLFLASAVPEAHADRGFVPLPTPAAEKPSGLQIRFVRYEGSTNGELSVEVRNPTKAPARFNASGLYFVPAGNANDAPQRLGAAGPFQVSQNDKWDRRDEVTIEPGATAPIRLDVYCIDSHRRSPQTGDVFRVAGKRMPRVLAESIGRGAATAAGSVGGFAAPAAKAKVQSEIWKNRDQKWIPLEGEGRQERGK